MIIANTAEGKTQRFDLTDDHQLEELTELIHLGHVTALSILHRGVQHSLPLPKRFGNRRPAYGVEVLRNGTRMPDGSQDAVGERVYCQVGDIRVSLSSTFTGALVRCDVVRMGRQQFDPRRRS